MTPDLPPSAADCFSDWVVASIRNSGLVPAGSLFDDREGDLGQIIQRKLKSGLGWAIGVGYCTLDETAEHDGDTYNVEVVVAAARNAALCKEPVGGIVQALFQRLKNKQFDTSLPYDWRAARTHCNHLRRSVNDGKETHTFTVSAEIILHNT